MVRKDAAGPGPLNRTSRLDRSAPRRRIGPGTDGGKARPGKGSAPLEGTRVEVVAEDGDPVRMQFLAALLRDAGIEPVMLDANLAGLGLAVFPRRLAVRREDGPRARRILADAGV